MVDVFRSKLTKRYLIIALVVLVLSLSSIYIITVNIMNSSVRQQISSRDELISMSLGKHIGLVIEKTVDDMHVLSNYALTDSGVDRTFLESEMQRIVVNNPLYLYVESFDKHGNVLTRVPYTPVKDPTDFMSIQNRLAWSKTYYVSNMIQLPNHMKTIAIAYPAIDSNGDYQGGTIAFVNLEVLSNYLEELKIGTRGINAVIDGNGTIIGNSNTTLIGLSIKHQVLGDYLYQERYGIWQGNLFNQTMIVGYKPLMIGGFGLIAGEPLDQALEPSSHLMRLLLQGFILVLLIAIGLTIFGTSRVIRPIDQLIRQVREYKDNKRKKFERVQTNDELEELSLVMGQMAQELTDKERRLFYILESIPYGVITLDKDGRITTANKGAEELTLFSRNEAIGKFIIDLPLKDNKDEFIAWKTVHDGKEYSEIETYILDKNGEKHDVKLYSSLFYGEDDRLLGCIVILRDVGEIKKLEEYLKQSERLASLGQLTAGIAHEIKNPLSIIQAAVEAIQLEMTDKEFGSPLLEQWINDILESTDRMNGLLTDFLMLTKGDDDGARDTVDVVPILDELIHLLRKNMADLGIKVECHYDAPCAPVLGNKNRLAQVFLNILINSLHAMAYGGNLYVRVIDKGSEWEVQIEDTGKGIPSSKLQWIFNPFFSTKRDGTGLGLSIAYEIISQHGGEITAVSTEGRGTTLLVLIPKAGE